MNLYNWLAGSRRTQKSFTTAFSLLPCFLEREMPKPTELQESASFHVDMETQIMRAGVCLEEKISRRLEGVNQRKQAGSFSSTSSP